MEQYVVARIRTSFLQPIHEEVALSYRVAVDSTFDELWFEMLADAGDLGLTIRFLEREEPAPGVQVVHVEDVTVDRRAAEATIRGEGIAPAQLSGREIGVRRAFFLSFGFTEGLLPEIEAAFRRREESEIQDYRNRGYFLYGTSQDHAEQGGIPDFVWHHPTVRTYIREHARLFGYIGSAARRREIDQHIVRVWLQTGDSSSLAEWLISLDGWEFMAFAKPNIEEEQRRVAQLIPEEVARRKERSYPS